MNKHNDLALWVPKVVSEIFSTYGAIVEDRASVNAYMFSEVGFVVDEMRFRVTCRRGDFFLTVSLKSRDEFYFTRAILEYLGKSKGRPDHSTEGLKNEMILVRDNKDAILSLLLAEPTKQTV